MILVYAALEKKERIRLLKPKIKLTNGIISNANDGLTKGRL